MKCTVSHGIIMAGYTGDCAMNNLTSGYIPELVPSESDVRLCNDFIALYSNEGKLSGDDISELFSNNQPNNPSLTPMYLEELPKCVVVNGVELVSRGLLFDISISNV